MKKKNSNGKTINSIEPGYLQKVLTGNGLEFVFLKLNTGYLRLQYDIETSPPLLIRISFVSSHNPYSHAIGNLLEFTRSSTPEDITVTFIEETGVSGEQWYAGRAAWGHTFEDESPASEGEKIGLSAWVDRCLHLMINPPQPILREIKKSYNPAADIEAVKAGDDKALNRFWKKCSPASEKEAALVLELLLHSVKEKDGEILFTCCDPLKRAAAGIPSILDTITGILETGAVSADYDRSELHEVLAVHAAGADASLSARWMEICDKSFSEKGVQSLHPVHEGWLFIALARAPEPVERVTFFLRRVAEAVEQAPAGDYEDVRELHSFREIKKAASLFR